MSSDGVIVFTTTTFERFAVAKSRPYSIFFFLMTEKLMEKPSLALRTLRREYGRVSRGYKAKYPEGTDRAGKVFFATLELETASDVFKRLGVESLPFVFRLPPHSAVSKTGSIEIPKTETMTFDQYPKYPWKAEAFADFVKKRAGIAAEIPNEEGIAPHLALLFFLLFISASIWTAIRLYQSPIVQSRILWMTGSLFICWFSTSGGMFNIIRNVPFVLPRDGKIQTFYQGNGSQLGAEGFMMGTLYVLFSLAVLVMTYGPAKMSDPSMRRLLLVGSLACAVFFLKQVVNMYTMKTGYPLEQYLFR